MARTCLTSGSLDQLPCMRGHVAARTSGWRLRFIQLGAMAKGIFFVLMLYRVTDYTYLTAAWLNGRSTRGATTVRRRKG